MFGNERSRDKIPMSPEVQISGDLFKEGYQSLMTRFLYYPAIMDVCLFASLRNPLKSKSTPLASPPEDRAPKQLKPTDSQPSGVKLSIFPTPAPVFGSTNPGGRKGRASIGWWNDGGDVAPIAWELCLLVAPHSGPRTRYRSMTSFGRL